MFSILLSRLVSISRSFDAGIVGVGFSLKIPSGLSIRITIKIAPKSRYSSQVTANGLVLENENLAESIVFIMNQN